MSKKTIISLLIFLALIAVVILGISAGTTNGIKPEEQKKLSTLASCLADKGVKFYGAYWCPHCADQKRMFGKAVKELPYEECAYLPGPMKKKTDEVLAAYKAGTYTGPYKKSLDEAKAIDKLDKWEAKQTEECVAKDIQGYPTWIFPDGSRIELPTEPAELAKKAQCGF